MSELVLDVRARARAEPPSFMRLLWAVLLGYFGAFVTLAVAGLGLEAVGALPRPYARPGPYAVTGAWSLDADLAIAAAVVLVAAWWIRSTAVDATGERVSFGIVAIAVAATSYAPFLALRPVGISGLIALPATTWVVRRYAIGRSLPIPHPSRRVWVVLAILGLLSFGSYQVYHPLISPGAGVGGGSGGPFRSITLQNAGWFGDLTILRVDGGRLGEGPGPWTYPRPPLVVRARSSTAVFVTGPTCTRRTIDVTYSLLGRTATQQFVLNPEDCNR